MNLKFGADPELFVKKDGQFISAHGLIPGTKLEPHPVDNGAVQVDGMALEFNIEPSFGFKQFQHNINTVLTALRQMVPDDYEFIISPTAEFDPKYMETLPEEALELGCDPDYNAWTGKVNDRPKQHPTMRTAAGHIHVGWTEDADPYSKAHFDLAAEVAREMDAWVGVYSVFHDNDQRRREMYGQAGAFRPKPYGMEYRVLSNFWLTDEDIMQNVFHYTQHAVQRVIAEAGIAQRALEQYNLPEVINTGDRDGARNIMGMW